eukprot:CAMPEP_0170627892 /NCGR_PEP_ID=MMETSP0224-20130122/32306_1 /TAXON_ID=285029 /ORGANISM="Togula jolla, Strain CCCM 725" /LENGTH=104 /DNA_ID=CAMNT_0010955107 /DNA_START=1 /DNA_END=315 /DNA_ORIENTATION=+
MLPVSSEDVERVSAFIATPNAVLLDVRNADEVSAISVPDALHIPLGELRGRAHELPRDAPIGVFCASGARSARACDLLRNAGLPAEDCGSFRVVLAARKKLSKS